MQLRNFPLFSAGGFAFIISQGTPMNRLLNWRAASIQQ